MRRNICKKKNHSRFMPHAFEEMVAEMVRCDLEKVENDNF